MSPPCKSSGRVCVQLRGAWSPSSARNTAANWTAVTTVADALGVEPGLMMECTTGAGPYCSQRSAYIISARGRSVSSIPVVKDSAGPSGRRAERGHGRITGRRAGSEPREQLSESSCTPSIHLRLSSVYRACHVPHVYITSCALQHKITVAEASRNSKQRWLRSWMRRFHQLRKSPHSRRSWRRR